MNGTTHKLSFRVPLLTMAALLCGYGAAAQQPRRDAGAAAATTANGEREALARAAMQSASASLEPLGERPVRGTVQFFGGPEGMTVHVQLTGATQGLHGFHVHESTDCEGADRPEKSIHFDPRGRPHGAPEGASERRHAGDLGNVLVGENGSADQWLQSRELTFDGELGIVGRTVVLHAREDDLQSQPGGESGPGVACGVIRMRPTPG